MMNDFGVNGWQSEEVACSSGFSFSCWVNKTFKGNKRRLVREFVSSNLDKAFASRCAIFAGETRDYVIDEANSIRLGRPVIRFGEQTYWEVWLVEECSIDKMIAFLYYLDYIGEGVEVKIDREEGMSMVVDFITRISIEHSIAFTDISKGSIGFRIMSEIDLQEYKKWYIESNQIAEMLFNYEDERGVHYDYMRDFRGRYKRGKILQICSI